MAVKVLMHLPRLSSLLFSFLLFNLIFVRIWLMILRIMVMSLFLYIPYEAKTFKSKSKFQSFVILSVISHVRINMIR